MKHMHKNISMLLVILVSILFVFVGCDDMKATAALAEKSYTVTFDSQAATTAANPTSKGVTSPATTIDGLPTAPEKTGYIFGGWFAEEAGFGSEFTESTEVPGDMTVYAKWSYGGTGPAGGYVFYDKGIFSDGWQYLEAAPSDIMLGESDYYHIFGYYRTTENGEPTLVGTETGIGTGKANTAALVGAMLEAAYTSESINTTTGAYAARLCNIHKVGEYEDWFLPSKVELNWMYENLHTQGVGGFSDGTYWSSSENESYFNYVDHCFERGISAWDQNFSNGFQSNYYRYDDKRVRPVRAF